MTAFMLPFWKRCDIMENILSLTREQLSEKLLLMGEKSFRAKQIFTWLHKKRITDFAQMTDISEQLRKKLSESFYISTVPIVQKLESKTDGTAKYLFEMSGGVIIEAVLMKYEYGNAVCISTQAGCAMGCTFCASTIGGLERSLTPGEMAGQIYTIEKDSGQRIHSLVLMGSGEPLDNYENVLRFISIINDELGEGLGQRRITLSTCGLADKIDELAQLGLQITLAVSLHAPNDEIRRRTMPVARKYDINTLITSAKNYAEKTGRRVTYEYALIDGVNDSSENAKELALRLKGSLCHVNLIPVNDVKERNYVRATEENISRFAKTLISMGIETTVRRRLGSDINASCGQLRRGYTERRCR